MLVVGGVMTRSTSRKGSPERAATASDASMFGNSSLTDPSLRDPNTFDYCEQHT